MGFSGIMKTTGRIIYFKCNITCKVKNPNWQEADQLAIYKRGRGVELGATEKQLPLAVRAGLEPGASGLQVRRHNPLDHAASISQISRSFTEKKAVIFRSSTANHFC